MNMQANDRRNLIEDLLRQSGEPVSAATLARQIGRASCRERV